MTTAGRSSGPGVWAAGHAAAAGLSAGDAGGSADVQHFVGRDARALGSLAAIIEPVELAGRVRVGVDGEQDTTGDWPRPSWPIAS
jgi:hypothetical protein